MVASRSDIFRIVANSEIHDKESFSKCRKLLNEARIKERKTRVAILRSKRAHVCESIRIY